MQQSPDCSLLYSWPSEGWQVIGGNGAAKDTQGTDVSTAAAPRRCLGQRLALDVHRLCEKDTGALAVRIAHPPE